MAAYRVPARLIPDLWSALLPHAERACEHHPFLEAEDVLTILLQGRAQLFIVTDDKGVMGFAAMEVVEYPRRRVANVMCLSGSRGFLSAVYPGLYNELVRWATEQSADTFAVHGRPGWLKVLRNEGGETHPHIAWTLRLGDVQKGRWHTNDGHGALGPITAVPN